MIWCQYIPHHLSGVYEAAGWEVRPLPCHHGWYSMLAVWRQG